MKKSLFIILILFLYLNANAYAYKIKPPEYYVDLYKAGKVSSHYIERVLNNIFKNGNKTFLDSKTSIFFYSKIPQIVVIDEFPEININFKKISNNCYYSIFKKKENKIYTFKYLNNNKENKWFFSLDKFPYYAREYNKIKIFKKEIFKLNNINSVVYLPFNYEKRRKDYPVLLVLDSQDLFRRTRLLNVLKFFISHRKIDEHIVIVKKIKNILSYKSFNDIKKDIEKNYRSSKIKIFSFVSNEYELNKILLIKNKKTIFSSFKLKSNINKINDLYVSFDDIKLDNFIKIPIVGSISYSFMKWFQNIPEIL